VGLSVSAAFSGTGAWAGRRPIVGSLARAGSPVADRIGGLSPAFSDEQLRVVARNVDDPADLLVGQVDPIDAVRELPGQPNFHTLVFPYA
jgi:hypothetical protein